MADNSELVYMDRKRVQRALQRMAYQISEDNRENREVCLIGIKQRGVVVARQLQQYISEIYDREFPLVELPRDGTLTEASISPSVIKESYPLVVDDVIFTGQTMFSALNKVYDFVAFDEIHTAVLVDRGHRTFPIQAQFVGLKLSTKLREHVSVVVDTHEVEQVVLGIG